VWEARWPKSGKKQHWQDHKWWWLWKLWLGDRILSQDYELVHSTHWEEQEKFLHLQLKIHRITKTFKGNLHERKILKEYLSRKYVLPHKIKVFQDLLWKNKNRVIATIVLIVQHKPKRTGFIFMHYFHIVGS
jgi:hypothetical protein